MDDRQLEDLRIPSSERLAVNACAEEQALRILCRTVGRGQCAASLAKRLPDSHVTCHFLDVFPAEDAMELLDVYPNLSVFCSPDLPQDEIDLFVLPLSRGGEAELAREWLQQGYDLLAPGGKLIATVDNPTDVWLHHEIEKFGRNIDRTPKRHGVVYRMKKLKPLKRMRDLSNQFAFRDGETLVEAASRPGVFSHRRLDLGARALLETIVVKPGDAVLDIGCGAGTVGISVALRGENIRVHAIDSNARAVQCTEVGAQLNGITTLTTGLTATGELTYNEADLSGTFDVAVGNPPYFSHNQIAEIFLQTAKRGLKVGGKVYIVTKHTEWLIARMQQLFDNVSMVEIRGYSIVTGIQRAAKNVWATTKAPGEAGE
ncbi:class I SAM-dependent methyltransferase [Planctomicrobium sp. SH668]|uniref:class I SAM-dependent methyltransferase n=1 Tax=Planctomicrobium sp. SH668 TaxID=3448126 RepID=UPI003F5BB0ED